MIRWVIHRPYQKQLIQNYKGDAVCDSIRRYFGKYSALVAPLLDEVFNKQSQNLQLAEARDRLLPKLMSGEMEL